MRVCNTDLIHIGIEIFSGTPFLVTDLIHSHSSLFNVFLFPPRIQRILILYYIKMPVTASGLLFDGLIKAKEIIQSTYRQFPLFITATIFFLGIIQTNSAYLFLSIGFFLFLFAIWLIQAILGSINFTPGGKLERWLTIPSAGNLGCSILGSSGRTEALKGGRMLVAPSYYMGFLAFFFIYLFRNAYSLYNREYAADADKEKIANRQYQAGMAMFVICLLFVLFTIIRWQRFGACETLIGSLAGIAIGGSLAYGWFEALQSCGGDSLSDLFGIIGRLVPASAADATAVACVVENQT